MFGLPQLSVNPKALQSISHCLLFLSCHEQPALLKGLKLVKGNVFEPHCGRMNSMWLHVTTIGLAWQCSKILVQFVYNHDYKYFSKHALHCFK